MPRNSLANGFAAAVPSPKRSRVGFTVGACDTRSFRGRLQRKENLKRCGSDKDRARCIIRACAEIGCRARTRYSKIRIAKRPTQHAREGESRQIRLIDGHWQRCNYVLVKSGRSRAAVYVYKYSAGFHRTPIHTRPRLTRVSKRFVRLRTRAHCTRLCVTNFCRSPISIRHWRRPCRQR